jgi:hypothetical protein
MREQIMAALKRTSTSKDYVSPAGNVKFAGSPFALSGILGIAQTTAKAAILRSITPFKMFYLNELNAVGLSCLGIGLNLGGIEIALEGCCCGV